VNCEWLDPTQCVAHLLMISRRKKRLMMECLWRKSPNADEGGTMIPPLPPPPSYNALCEIPNSSHTK